MLKMLAVFAFALVIVLILGDGTKWPASRYNVGTEVKVEGVVQDWPTPQQNRGFRLIHSQSVR